MLSAFGLSVAPLSSLGPIAFVLSAGVGAVSVTGQPAAAQRSSSSAATAYVITGQAAGASRTRPADVGAFALTGQAALSVRRQASGVGAYTLTGQPSSFTRTGYLNGGLGQYATAGGAAVFTIGRQFPAAVGAYTLIGQDARIGRSTSLPAAAGAYVTTGQAAQLGRSFGGRVVRDAVWSYFAFGEVPFSASERRLYARPGHFTLIGYPADLIWYNAVRARARDLSGPWALMQQISEAAIRLPRGDSSIDYVRVRDSSEGRPW